MNNRPDDALFAHCDSRLQQRGDTVRGTRGLVSHIRGRRLHLQSEYADLPCASLRATAACVATDEIVKREPA